MKRENLKEQSLRFFYVQKSKLSLYLSHEKSGHY